MCISDVLSVYPTHVELGSYPGNNQEPSRPASSIFVVTLKRLARWEISRPGVEEGRGPLPTPTLGPSLVPVCVGEQGQERVVSEGPGAKDDTAFQSQSSSKGVPKAKGLESAKKGDRTKV